MSDLQAHSSPSESGKTLSPDKAIMVQVPPLTAPHPLLRSLPTLTRVPADLLDLLNQTYFLHLLANDPSKVLPPGKSLLSVMSGPSVRQKRDDEPPRLQDKVEEMIHKAFWDEVLHHLRIYSSLLTTVFARPMTPSPPESLPPSSPVSSSCSMTCTPPFRHYSLQGTPSSLSCLPLLRLHHLLFLQHSITAVRPLPHSVSVAHQHATITSMHSLLRLQTHPLIHSIFLSSW